MWKEFKEFALKGNVLELAIGVIMAGAFGLIVKSVVENILMPAIGMIFGAPDFSAIDLGAMHVGKFLNAVVSFIFIAVAMFIFVKLVSKIMPKRAVAAEAMAEAHPTSKPAPLAVTKPDGVVTPQPATIAKAKRKAPVKAKPSPSKAKPAASKRKAAKK